MKKIILFILLLITVSACLSEEEIRQANERARIEQERQREEQRKQKVQQLEEDKNQCRAYGLKYGTGDFANCMREINVNRVEQQNTMAILVQQQEVEKEKVRVERERLEFKKRAYNSEDAILERARARYPGYRCEYRNARGGMVKCWSPDNTKMIKIDSSDLEVR